MHKNYPLPSRKLFNMGEILIMYNTESRALHSEILSKISSRVSSRNEFSRVETRWVERHFFDVFGKFGKKQLPKLAKMKIAKKRIFSWFFRNFSQKLGLVRVFASRNPFGRSSKNSSRLEFSVKLDFRNSRKEKFRQKPSFAGP